MEGDWLGNPANIKGGGYCLERRSRDNDRAIIRAAFQNNMAEYSDLFLFGDDLEVVLKALETDDNVDEYFEEAVTEVSVGIHFYSYLLTLALCSSRSIGHQQ